MAQPHAIGIDLGTTNTCAAIFKNGKVEIILNDAGKRTTPSYVAFTKNEIITGNAAKAQMIYNPENTVFEVKRLIGRRFDDDIVHKHMKHWPFKIVNNCGSPKIEVNFKNKRVTYHPEEISGMVLKKMKEAAEISLPNEKISNAVITVPAYFTDSQKQATKDAARLAGLNVLRLLNEPTAAAIAYGFNHITESKVRTILVYDLGGGTFDISILKIKGTDFEVKAKSGNTNLGGEDFNRTMMEYFIEQFRDQHHKDFTADEKAMLRLRAACERAKEALSFSTDTIFEVDSIFDKIDIYTNITRNRFESLNIHLFESTIKILKECLKDIEMTKSDIDEIVLVGGSTRIPKIQSLLEEFFDGRKLHKRSVNPDEAVAYGAAILADELQKDSNETPRLTLQDIVALSLGVEVNGGIMNLMIKRNSPIPSKNTQSYTTAFDNQTRVAIKIYEGEGILVKDNKYLGSFTLEDLPKAPKGSIKIQVTYHIDADGILTAKAISSDKKKEIRVDCNKGRLSQKEIDRILKEAVQNQKEDERRVETVKKKMELESYCLEMQNLIRNCGGFRDFLRSIENSLRFLEENGDASFNDYAIRLCTLKAQAFFYKVVTTPP